MNRRLPLPLITLSSTLDYYPGRSLYIWLTVYSRDWTHILWERRDYRFDRGRPVRRLLTQDDLVREFWRYLGAA